MLYDVQYTYLQLSYCTILLQNVNLFVCVFFVLFLLFYFGMWCDASVARQTFFYLNCVSFASFIRSLFHRSIALLFALLCLSSICSALLKWIRIEREWNKQQMKQKLWNNSSNKCNHYYQDILRVLFILPRPFLLFSFLFEYTNT